MVDYGTHDLVIQHEVVGAGQQHAAADVFGRRIIQRRLPRHDLRKLGQRQIIERPREHVLADGPELAILVDTEVCAEIGVLVVAVAHILLPVEAVSSACGKK